MSQPVLSECHSTGRPISGPKSVERVAAPSLTNSPSQLFFFKLLLHVWNNKICKLTEEDIENCKKWNFAYDENEIEDNIPSGNEEDPVIEEEEKFDLSGNAIKLTAAHLR